jgi:hypothetical protein
MIDIAMCQSESCPKRERCYRFRATPDDLAQWYGQFQPGVDGECDGFLPLPDDIVRKRTDQGYYDVEDTPVMDRATSNFQPRVGNLQARPPSVRQMRKQFVLHPRRKAVPCPAK